MQTPTWQMHSKLPQILAGIGVGRETVQDRESPSCYWPLMRICIRAFDWYQNRWPWLTYEWDSGYLFFKCHKNGDIQLFLVLTPTPCRVAECIIFTGWSKKLAQKFLYALTLPNINRFTKLFHLQNQEKICNNTITKDPTTPQVCRHTVATIPCEISVS